MTFAYDPPLGTIEEEAAACRAAWAANPAKWGWHIHHDTLCEERAYPIEDRIGYILTQKPMAERALRLRLMRPAPALAPIRKTYDDALAPIQKTYDDARAPIEKTYDDAMAPIRKTYDDALAAIRKTYADAMAAAHAEQCPGCPWDGETIFGGAK